MEDGYFLTEQSMKVHLIITNQIKMGFFILKMEILLADNTNKQ